MPASSQCGEESPAKRNDPQLRGLSQGSNAAAEVVKNRRHRTVVVAGASPGVGRLIARQVARAGARFALINPASRLMPVIAGGLILFGLSLLARRGALRLASVPRHLPALAAGLAEVVKAARPRPSRRVKARSGGRLARPSKTKKPRRRA
jgi:hypothetical protein